MAAGDYLESFYGKAFLSKNHFPVVLQAILSEECYINRSRPLRVGNADNPSVKLLRLTIVSKCTLNVKLMLNLLTREETQCTAGPLELPWSKPK